MGGLAHYIEDEGVPTTSISLIREHTEVIKPPRALWVSFELGRPLGAPNDEAFQTDVLVTALRLLDAPRGPVIEDYPQDAPGVGGTVTWACPVNFGAAEEALSETERLRQAFKREVAQLRSWYDLAVRARARTTVGVSGLDPDAFADFIAAFLDEGLPQSPRDDLPVAVALKLAVEDCKAYYFEAVTAQPGQGAADSHALAEWFWQETAGGKLLVAVKDACASKEDGMVGAIGTMMIVPIAQVARGD